MNGKESLLMDRNDIADEFRKGYVMTEKDWKVRQRPYDPAEEQDTSLLNLFRVKKERGSKNA